MRGDKHTFLKNGSKIFHERALNDQIRLNWLMKLAFWYGGFLAFGEINNATPEEKLN
jgi:hypothetical protein